MFESVNARTDAQTPARLPSYKLTQLKTNYILPIQKLRQSKSPVFNGAAISRTAYVGAKSIKCVSLTKQAK